LPFEITTPGNYILTRGYGVVTAEDLRALADQAEAAEARHQTANRLSDLTAVESFDFDFTAVSALADRRRALRHDAPIKSAIIAVKPVAIGFARMFQTLNDNPQVEIRIVASRAEAETWFAEA
jgi:hypothetical protein